MFIGHLNVNSVRNKINVLKSMTEDNIDILVISQTKIDNSFPVNQFSIDGYNLPYRLDRNQDGGGLLVYFRTGIPSRKLKTNLPENVEWIFFDTNIRNKKWQIFAGYNPKKEKKFLFMLCWEVSRLSNRKIQKLNPDWRYELPNGRRCHERIL